MKRLNNSRPLSVAVLYAPLSTSCHIVALNGMPTMQAYRGTTFVPDHTAAVAYDAVTGQQVNGALRLRAEWSMVDPDGLLMASDVAPTVRWTVGGVAVTTTDTTQDYYIDGVDLVVRKNIVVTDVVDVDVEVTITDPRNGAVYKTLAHQSLASSLQEDMPWRLYIIAPRVTRHAPLTAGSTSYQFSAKAMHGDTDATASTDILWEWTWSEDGGVTWRAIGDEEKATWCAGGENTSTLNVDADFTERITVRVRIKDSATGVWKAAEATATLAWRWPDITATAFSPNGDKLLAKTTEVQMKLLAHNKRHGELTDTQIDEWLVCSWEMRRQGVQPTASSPAVSLGYGATTRVSAADIRAQNAKVIIAPKVSMRGAYALLQDSAGNYLQTSTGDYIAARS